MATEQMFTSLPTVSSATMSDIICAVQGYTSPSNLGLSVQETLQQVYNLFQSNIILSNSGNPNGTVAGTTYQFCWDTLDDILWVCVTSGTSSTAVWIRANINNGFTTTATSAGTTTLTILSNYWQFFTGSTTQTVVMPVASTLALGMSWSIVNNSSGNVTVQSSGGNTIVTLSSGQAAIVTCILTSGTSAASWNAIASSMTAVTYPLSVSNGGTGISTVPTNGQVPIGNGTNYVAATLTAGTNISVSNGSGSITISATGLAGIGWVNVTGATQAMVADTGYVADRGTLVTFTLPATAAFGTIIYLQGLGAGGWTIAQNAGQNIQIGSSSSTTGVSGSVSSTNQYDSVTLLCVTANTTWTSLGASQSSGLTIV
jgi:hypothetical protein